MKFENTEVWGFKHALRGLRNPMNSWNKSDSYYGCPNGNDYSNDNTNCDKCLYDVECTQLKRNFVIGENDLALAQKLIKAGTEHRKFLRQIFVSVDITAPLYWWKEADQYRIGVTTNSCSTMHKLMSKPFEMNDFSFDELPGYRNEVKQFRPIVDEDMVAEEIWKCFDEEYDISNYGRVKHKFKNHYRIISGSIHYDGYIFVTLHSKQYPLHKLVAELFCYKPNIDNLVVNHKDGNKQNNFAENLEWVTQQENIQHSFANNFQPKGLSSYTGKFTESQREEIKRLWDSGEKSKREIAKIYNVSHTTICSIINDKYKYTQKINVFEEVARPLIDTLNEMRDSYISCKNEKDKKIIWYSIIQLLPSSYNQKRTITMNYENILSMYHQRKDHRLNEWSGKDNPDVPNFCSWVRTLPYAKELIIVEE